jgi:hypothetical protein
MDIKGDRRQDERTHQPVFDGASHGQQRERQRREAVMNESIGWADQCSVPR